MYWHGSLDNTRRMVEKIITDRAKGILVITGIGSTPCPLEGLKSTLDSITLNEMSFGPEEELFIDAKGVSMPSPGQAWGTKVFLLDGAQAQPTGDEAFIRRVEAVPMKVMFEPKEGRDQPVDGIDVLSHAEIDDVVNYMRTGMLKVLPWVVDGAGGLGAGKTSGAGTRGVDLNAAVGGRTGYTDTNGGESSNNGSKIHVDCYPAENPSL